MNKLYLAINILSVVIPFALSFDKKVNFKQYWPFLSAGIVFALFIFIPWDIGFTKIGVWGFNPEYISGIYFFNLPIEEWMFFITIPYSSIFTYEVIRAYFPHIRFPNKLRYGIIGLAIVLFVIALLKPGFYTSINFIGLSLLLMSYQTVAKNDFWGYFLLTYLVILLPFTAVNGVLTGSFIENEIVWYNNEQNLGIRLFTIPVEDIFYGMFLILTVLVPYEFLKGKFLPDNTTR